MGKLDYGSEKGGISLGKFNFISLLLIGSLIIGLAGCTSLPTGNTSKLKVMSRDKKEFNTLYGDMFHTQNDSIKIQLVEPKNIELEKNDSNYVQALQQSIEEKQLDVLQLSTYDYNRLSEAGFLLDLESLVVRDYYNIDTIYPSITRFLRDQGDGRLYGFAPTFQRQVIYYNIDLFDQYGIEPPRDGMNWQELIDLARLFPSDGDEQSRIYGGFTCFGLNKENPLRELGLMIGLSTGLRAINLDTMQVTMDTEGWKQAYQQAQEALSTNAINVRGYNSDEDFDAQQLFAKGQQAMLIAHEPSWAYSVLDYIKSGKSEVKPFRVGMVVGPTDASNREITRDLNLSNDYIYAIRANSSNVDAAWELLKFMQGNEVASKLAKRPDHGIPSRMGQTSDYYGINLDGFYHLTSVQQGGYVDDPKEIIPDEFYEKYEEITYRELNQVEKSRKSFDEVLQTIQRDAQVALDEAMLARKVHQENGREEPDHGMVTDMTINWDNFRKVPFK